MIEINLIPEVIQRSQIGRRHLKRWLAASLLAGGLVSIPIGMEFARRAEAAELRAQQADLQASLTSIRQQVSSVTATAARLRGQIARANALRAKRAWSGMFHLLAMCLPKDAWLTSIATDPPTPVGGASRISLPSVIKGKKPKSDKTKSVTIEAPHRLILKGFAPDQTGLYLIMSQLKRTGAFTEVTLKQSSDMSWPEERTVVSFELHCDWSKQTR